MVKNNISRVFYFAILVKIRNWISIFLLLINVIVIKHVIEILILLLEVDICDIWVTISYFDQILGERESQTWQVLNFVGIQFHEFVVLKLFVGTKFRKNGQKSWKLRNLTSPKFNTFKLYTHILLLFCFVVKVYWWLHWLCLSEFFCC